MKILLAGDGGQGVQTIAKIMTQAARKSNKFSSYIPAFGVEQRGGVSLAYVQIDDKNIAYSRFAQADIIVIFCKRAVEVIKPFIKDHTLVIYDNSAIDTKSLALIKNSVKNYIAIPAQKIAQTKYSTKVLNMIMLGALSQTVKDVSIQEIENQIVIELHDKIAQNHALSDLNMKAFHEGQAQAGSFDQHENEFIGIDEPEIELKFEDDKKTWTRYPEYCKGCALCVVRCPVKALKFNDDLGFLGNPMPIVDINTCIACELCEKTCPDGAIKVENK